MPEIETITKVVLIGLYCLFSVIRIEYYRRTRKAGFKTVIEERKRYSVWLSVFICYEVFTFFLFILFPDSLSWAGMDLPYWARLLGIGMGATALAWFIWIHQSLGDNLSATLKIKDRQVLVTDGPYRFIRHPMYSAFYLLHVSVFFMTANWFIGTTWLAGLTVIMLIRITREEQMLLERFGNDYHAYMAQTGRFVPRIRV